MFRHLSLTLLLLTFTLAASSRTLSIRHFGARPGALSTSAIRRAISSSRPGDTILIPSGTYRTGTVRLKSHTTLLLAPGSELLGTTDLAAYDHLRPSHDMSRYDTGAGTRNANLTTDTSWTQALLLAERVVDVTLCGSGTINGGHLSNPSGEESMRGPHALLLSESRNIRIEGITITCAGNYAILGFELDSCLFRGLNITEGWDGIHIRGGSDLLIDSCDIRTGDDAIAGGYWHRMSITRCSLNSSCNGIRMIEPSHDLLIHSCRIYGPGLYPHRTSGAARRTSSIYGIVLEPGAWGYAPGRTENVRIISVTIDNLLSPLVYSIGDDNTCSGLFIDGLHVTRVTYNTIPLNPQSCTRMWHNISIRNYTID